MHKMLLILSMVHLPLAPEEVGNNKTQFRLVGSFGRGSIWRFYWMICMRVCMADVPSTLSA